MSVLQSDSFRQVAHQCLDRSHNYFPPTMTVLVSSSALATLTVASPLLKKDTLLHVIVSLASPLQLKVVETKKGHDLLLSLHPCSMHWIHPRYYYKVVIPSRPKHLPYRQWLWPAFRRGSRWPTVSISITRRKLSRR